MDLANITIETERLRLVPLREKYRRDIFKEFTPEITAYMYPRPAKNIEETDEFIGQALEKIKNGQDLQMVILDKSSNEFMGCAGLHDVNTLTPELGIWLKKSAQGNGRGLETIRALKKWADENLKYNYILYPVADKNKPSIKIAESLGGKLAREYNQKALTGTEHHLLEYRIYPNKTRRQKQIH